MLKYINTTTNKSGLRVTSVRVTKQYHTGVKITKQQMAEVNLYRNETLPQWNYDIHPHKKTAPARQPTDDCTSEQHLPDC